MLAGEFTDKQEEISISFNCKNFLCYYGISMVGIKQDTL